MTARDSFNEQHAFQSSQQYERPVAGITVTILAIFAYIVYEYLLRIDAPLRAIPRTLWKRSTGMFKRGLGVHAGSLLKGISRDPPLRGVSMLMKGASSDIPPGLGNWDNSCYQNSIIQGLASLHALQDFLSTVTAAHSELDTNTTNGALRETIDKLNNPSNHGQRLWTPAKLKSMSSWQQQDAQEYFSKIMDEVDKEITKISTASRPRITPGLESINSTGPYSDQERISSDANEKVSDSKNTGLLQNPLEGLLAQRVGCMRCGYSEGLSMIPFNCLTVPLGRNWLYDVRDCLDEYTKLEPIDGVECARCTLLRAEAQLKKMAESSSREGSPATEAFRSTLKARLSTVQEALEDKDFSDTTLIKKCNIPKAQWVSSTKSRQAVVGRAPRSLVVHVNRSLFDESTGAQMKNYAEVRFPGTLDLGPWCLGTRRPVGNGSLGNDTEAWSMDPTKSMLPDDEEDIPPSPLQYKLRAVVTHYGRHENGHYICYRKHPYSGADDSDSDEDQTADESLKAGFNAKPERWWRLSDEDVLRTSEEEVLRQGGVFMLFYERIHGDIDIPSSPAAVSVPESNSTIAPRTEEDMLEPGEKESQPAPVPDAEGPPLAHISELLEDHPAQAPLAPEIDPLSDLAHMGSVESTLPTSPRKDMSLTAAASDTRSDVQSGQLQQPADAPPSIRKPLSMRTASPTSRLYGEDSLSSSTFRMVAAT